MAKTSATLDVIYNLSMFKDKFEQLENESLNKGGTANGINQQVEYYANLANAVVYTATNVLTSSALEKFLKDYGDILNISSDLSNYTGNIVGDKVRNYLYNNIDEIDSFKQSVPKNIINQNSSINNILNLEKSVYDLYSNNVVKYDYYSIFSKNITNNLIYNNPQSPYYQPKSVVFLDQSPIGAFYESSTSQIDNSKSIADKTFTIIDSSNHKITKEQLENLDINSDGKLSENELLNLKTWKDLNEDGIAQASEISTLNETIYKKDYDSYTKGNSKFQNPTAITQIAPISNYVNVAKTVTVPVVPGSNFASLRATDNGFVTKTGVIISWQTNQVKINQKNQTYLIGTDGNDSFDYRYYAQYSSWFDINILRNFLAGGGDDTVGGSNYSDNIWGGTGNDTLYGYDGDDNIYGEEGHDTLLGQNGNDKLFGGAGNDLLYGHTGNDSLYGGIGDDELHGNESNDLLVGEAGNDKIFGEVGNDTIYGGDGDDILVGFTASNDSKQILASGETDDDLILGGNGNDYIVGGLGTDRLYGEAGRDTIYGGNGNDYIDGGIEDDILLGENGIDIIYGGDGNDEIQGGDGDDILLGENGNDKIFGQVGNDTIYGGDGDDILVGFTPLNETKQTLASGETDNDTIYGGNGNDYILGGLGNDTLFGDEGNDEIQGGVGIDMIYGGTGDDRLFGQEGDDIIYGGDGDDLIIGFRGFNEDQTLGFGESDNDFLYGGAGNDTILGGLGDDYIDGGEGADIMEGGKGDDFYIVNSINDSILEFENEGYDIVVSSTNYLLNKNIEELRLVEGYKINATGNSLDNILIGNSYDNIIDGVTGADTMIGGLGNDLYYVDDIRDNVVENVNEGVDTVYSTINYTLRDNVENLRLLDFSVAEHGLVDNEKVLVYGYPKMYELDYMQGDAVENFQGTCALTSIANLLTQNKTPTSEAEVVNLAINNSWTVANPEAPAHIKGGSNYIDQQNILNSYGLSNGLLAGYNPNAIANLIQSGRGVILAVNAGYLWNESSHIGTGAVNHVVTVTGAVYKESDGSLTGFYIADSGRGKVSDMTRYISLDKFAEAVNVPSSYAIYTNEPIKLWNENVNAYGNDTDNIIIGNRGDNELYGYQGKDSLEAGRGNDTIFGGSGDDTYIFNKGDGEDIIFDESGMDNILFTDGINSNDILFSYNENDLIINYGDDKLTVTNQRISNSSIEKIELSNGNYLTNSDIENIIQQMNAYAQNNGIDMTNTQDMRDNENLMAIVQNSWKVA